MTTVIDWINANGVAAVLITVVAVLFLMLRK